MTPCRRFEEWISASVDGELPARTDWQLKTHLSSCRHCQAMEAKYRWSRKTLAMSLQRQSAPDSLRQWLKKTAAAQPYGNKRKSLYVVLAIICFIAAGFSAAWILHYAPSATESAPKQLELIKAEVVSDHIRCMLRPGGKVDFETANPKDAERWLHRYLDFAFEVPRLHRSDLQLLGARITYFLERRVGSLLYRGNDSGQFASLFILNGRGLESLPTDYAGAANPVRHGYRISAWKNGDIFYLFTYPDPRSGVASGAKQASSFLVASG